MINMCMRLKETIQEHMISHLLRLCQDELKLDQLPEIKLISEPYIGTSKKSFGEFDGNSIKVVIKDRHSMDILRTLAHELVHWKQRLIGMDMDGSDGSEVENQANAIAGVIMRKFGEKYPDYFIDSLP